MVLRVISVLNYHPSPFHHRTSSRIHGIDVSSDNTPSSKIVLLGFEYRSINFI